MNLWLQGGCLCFVYGSELAGGGDKMLQRTEQLKVEKGLISAVLDVSTLRNLGKRDKALHTWVLCKK